jgi:hypothetical protein
MARAWPGRLARCKARQLAIVHHLVRPSSGATSFPRLLESYGLQLPEEWYVGPERAGSLCARLASGRYDGLSGRFLGIDDDLDGLLNRTGEIVARELYTLRIQA